MHQQILLLTYRDGVRHAHAANVLGIRERNVYLLTAFPVRRTSIESVR